MVGDLFLVHVQDHEVSRDQRDTKPTIIIQNDH